MDSDNFRKFGHQLVDWMADYLDAIDKYPVKSQVSPKEIINQLPPAAPSVGEDFATIFSDFEKIIMPGITHWQHPSFFAYFPANSSRISVLAEMLTATIAAQCMIWDTSPAAAELEERMMEWLQDLLGLPSDFVGVIQDTASTATLCSLLSAREKVTNHEVNAKGFYNIKEMVIYCSTETHSSIEKAVKIIGIGKDNLRAIEVDENFAMRADLLEAAIKEDKSEGYIPLAVVATLGTTGTTSVDPLKTISDICKKYSIWLHVDAAYAGSALVLPDKRWMIEGIENVDSFVFNPHKWLFTNFDCSAYFVKDPEVLVKTFEILPEYLKTKARNVNNYRDWGIPLGRRFRALKLWFVLRHYGKKGLQEKVKLHIELAEFLQTRVQLSEDFELLAPVHFGLVCFRYHPPNIDDEDELNQMNELLVGNLNCTGKLYFTHTKLNGKYTIRFSIGQTEVKKDHIENAWELIQQEKLKLS
ncbi:MAG: pyridoxal phosphate-dependent decarboxylase family protein [Candidatus Kariarchaeaceae archaeon]|jgi:aromatic-L-amino-acid decarboxylase